MLRRPIETTHPKPTSANTTTLQPVIARYTRPEMGAVWTDERRLGAWLEVELAALDAHVDLGIVPAQDAAAIRAGARVDVVRAKEIEERTHHDVIAFTETITEQVGPPARWFHYGLTSSDVVDTGLGMQLRDAGALLLVGVEQARAAVLARALEHRATPCMGRTHGVHAEPTTFGLKLLGWVFELDRAHARLATATDGVAVGKLSGAVGAYGNIDPKVEQQVLARLGLGVEPASTQVVARDRHAAFLAAIAITGSSLDRFATELRHLQRSEVRETEEPFGKGQKGSSAMPHKKNPITCERISGLARILRGNALVGFENVPLWHERDISHSSAERVVLADSPILLDYMLAKFTWVMNGLVVRADRMRSNLDASQGLPFSGRVLLALVEAGMTREDAYEVVQRNAMQAWESGEHLRDLVLADPAAALLDQAVIANAFNLDDVLARVDVPFGRLGV